LAKERGACEYFGRTKYSQGILPIDTYKRDIDEVLGTELHYDWESLRADILQHGLRHSTLSAQMPSESSSVASNETNGIEPPRDLLSVKKSKKGTLKQIVPAYQSLKNHYTLLWDMKGNEGYIRIVAAMQKYFDQAISGNWSYNPKHYENNEVPLSIMLRDLLTSYKLGWKTSYYQNTYDMKSDDGQEALQKVEQPVQLESIADDAEVCDACAI
jgi:ribonucleoside-diphosphate reductase alpha chain